MRAPNVEVPSGDDSPHPSIFLLLNLPFAITGGYITVAVPYLVTRAGLAVLMAASIVAIGLAPKVGKLFWAPIADIGLTLKKWYVIGAATASGMLLLQGLVPLTSTTVPFVAAALFTAELGSSLLSPSLGGLVPTRRKSRGRSWRRHRSLAGRTRDDASRARLGARLALAASLACASCMNRSATFPQTRLIE